MILVITNVLSSISSLGTSRKQLQLHPELRHTLDSVKHTEMFTDLHLTEMDFM